MAVQPITETMLLDYCYVCQRRKDSMSGWEEHHIVPRHLGGSKGPTITLCGTCHTQTHDTANALYKGKTYLPFKDQHARERCLYLATVIVKARLSVEAQGNLNKRYVYTDVFTYQEHELLVKLGKHYSKGQKDLIRFALQFLAKHTF